MNKGLGLGLERFRAHAFWGFCFGFPNRVLGGASGLGFSFSVQGFWSEVWGGPALVLLKRLGFRV